MAIKSPPSLPCFRLCLGPSFSLLYAQFGLCLFNYTCQTANTFIGDMVFTTIPSYLIDYIDKIELRIGLNAISNYTSKIDSIIKCALYARGLKGNKNNEFWRNLAEAKRRLAVTFDHADSNMDKHLLRHAEVVARDRAYFAAGLGNDLNGLVAEDESALDWLVAAGCRLSQPEAIGRGALPETG